jgi:hypothetical protein
MGLATQLVDAGVDVRLDKWDLREGHDAVQYMESMVTDPTVAKVVVVSDKAYAEKADNRKGGVGTESQIMSPEIYKRADQNKFVAVVPEVDANGEPYLPKFFSSRIYIDMTEARYATNFEQLLRWIYDKPLFVKPALGKMPAFLNNVTAPNPTGSKARRTIEIINSATGSPAASTTNYLESLADVLRAHRVDVGRPDFPDAVIENIEAFLPYRNEFIEFMRAAASGSMPELAKTLQRFFETVIPLMSRPPTVTSWREWDFDNYVFLVHELFLYAIALLLRYERFATVTEFLALRFYVRDENNPREVMHPFTVVERHTSSLYAKQQELRRVSLRADLLEQRSHVSGLNFAEVMQADFVLFLRAATGLDAQERPWYPHSLLYTTRHNGPFEIFARSESIRYFANISPIVGLKDKSELEQLISTYSTHGQGGRWLPHWNYNSLQIGLLSNAANLQSRP